MLQTSSPVSRESQVVDPGAVTVAAWLADGRSAAPQESLRLITRIANALVDAHQQGVRHGALTPDEVLLSGWSSASLGEPVLQGFAPSAGWPRREDIAGDVAGLAAIARALLLPAPPQPARSKQRTIPTAQQIASGSRRTRAAAAVIGAGLDRREGVFVFESALDFVMALETAMAADAGAVTAPDPALQAMRQRRRRRRLIKVVTGMAVACLALLVVSNATAGRATGRAGAEIAKKSRDR